MAPPRRNATRTNRNSLHARTTTPRSRSCLIQRRASSALSCKAWKAAGAEAAAAGVPLPGAENFCGARGTVPRAPTLRSRGADRLNFRACTQKSRQLGSRALDVHYAPDSSAKADIAVGPRGADIVEKVRGRNESVDDSLTSRSGLTLVPGRLETDRLPAWRVF